MPADTHPSEGSPPGTIPGRGPDDHPLTLPRAAAIAAAALAAGAAVIALQLASDHRDAPVVWAVFGPAVIWSFVGTGLYAWRARPESRIGLLMVLLGFAWFLFTLDAANAPWLYTIGLVLGGLWGGVFLHLGLSFPSGRLTTRLDRRLVIAGYFIFPLAFVPSLLFAEPGRARLPRLSREPPADPPGRRPRHLAHRVRGAALLRAVRGRAAARAASAGAAPTRSSACRSRRSTCARWARSCS